ncbi:MAG: NfeD family protein [Flavobacteriales bacterium]|nr:NfeD family protein [Flavobacteriales bacterium]
MEILFVWWAWLVAAIILLIVEILLPGFIVGCFAVGAVVAAIVAVFGAGVNAQIFTFAFVTLGVFIFIRPFAIKYLMKDSKHRVTTNHDALPGRIGRVISDIDNEAMRGEVRVDGDIFMARSLSGEPIKKDTDVKIEKIDSIILIVSPVENVK